MKVYLSGPQESWREQIEHRHLLVSYAEPGKQLSLLDKGWACPGWLVDCGAFTRWTKGRPVDLDAYIAFCLDLERRAAAGEFVLDGYLALDVIPGEPGRMPTLDECREATEQSLANLAKMRAAGLSPIPIYHEGEPMAVLDAYVAEGHDLIALGATASRGQRKVIDWLLPIFERHPGQAFHGLAMTQARLLASLPFASVDSTSWINPCRYGLRANSYLLKGRSGAFWKGLGYDQPPPDAVAVIPDLEARGKRFLLQVGADALCDAWRCPAGGPPTKDGQMLVAPTEILGVVPKSPSMASRAHTTTAPGPPPPRPVAPGQLPLWGAA